MTRAWDADFKTQLQSADPKPLILLEIETGDVGTPWIRMTSGEKDIVWPTTTGSTFTARPFGLGGFNIEQASRGLLELRLSDTDGYWKTWLASTSFRWKRMKRWLVERDELGTTAKSHLDVFRFNHRERTDREVVFFWEPFSAVLRNVQLPRLVMTRETFPGLLDAGVIR